VKRPEGARQIFGSDLHEPRAWLRHRENNGLPTRRVPASAATGALLFDAIVPESNADMRLALFLLPLAMLACTGKDDSSGQGQGGQIESAGTGNVALGGSAHSGGSDANPGGAATGGGGTSLGGQSDSGASAGGRGPGLVDCDQRQVVCKIAQPICPENQVPSVDGSCFGPCVPIEACACSDAQDCPLNERYTCWQRTHCGPYVH
jgi:hypothetical protein